MEDKQFRVTTENQESEGFARILELVLNDKVVSVLGFFPCQIGDMTVEKNELSDTALEQAHLDTEME